MRSTAQLRRRSGVTGLLARLPAVMQTRSSTGRAHRLRDLRDLWRATRRRRKLRKRVARDAIEPVRVLPEPEPRDIVCLLKCRDESLRLPDFLAHHRKLGVDRFVVIDNGSSDATSELILDQSDTDLFRTDASLLEASAGITWFQHLLDRYGSGRWYLVFDADELIAYEGMEDRDLHHAAENLDRRRRLALTAYIVDMYPNGPVDELAYRPGDSLIAACPLFDGSGYEIADRPGRAGRLTGGPRQRVLGWTPYLRKTPFFRHTPLFAHRTIHVPVARRHSPKPEAALLHFKLLADFRAKVDAAVTDRQYWKRSAEYEAIQASLGKILDLDFRYEGSRPYQGAGSFIDAGLMCPFPW
jgi:glycosyltransferase involved in cell wall biosynthesis